MLGFHGEQTDGGVERPRATEWQMRFTAFVPRAEGTDDPRATTNPLTEHPDGTKEHFLFFYCPKESALSFNVFLCSIAQWKPINVPKL